MELSRDRELGSKLFECLSGAKKGHQFLFRDIGWKVREFSITYTANDSAFREFQLDKTVCLIVLDVAYVLETQTIANDDCQV